MTSTDVVAEIAAERRRQVEAEGWSSVHDDSHTGGDLGYAAAAYVLSAIGHYPGDRSSRMPGYWPWDRSWWKPSSPRRDLVKAAALIVAEIERMDRITEITQENDDGR